MTNLTEPTRPAGGGKWKLLVGALLVGHVCLMATIALVAGRGDNYTVVPDYYRRAINFDKEQELKRQSAALGWNVKIDAAGQPDAAGQRAVTFHLVDSQGAGIDGAALDVMYFHHANGDAIRNLRLEERDCRGGKFSLPVLMQKPGMWEFQLRAVARGQTYVQTTRLMVGMPGRTP